MKTYPYNLILFAFAFFAIVACSKKEDPITQQAEALSLTLSCDTGSGADIQIVPQGETVNFTVLGNDGEEYTANATFYVNDAEILDASYTFDVTGNFSVKAVYGNATSNILGFEVLAETERVVTIDVLHAMKNQTITFGLLDSDGNNTAGEATFYIDGAPISGFTYTPTQDGSFEVYAEFMANGETFTTGAKNFSTYIPRRNVVIEDYTGTWCGFCLRAVVAIDSVKVLTDHVSIVAIHKTSFTHADPMDFPRIVDMQSTFDVPNSFPQTQLNRVDKWNEPYNYNTVTSIAGTETDLSIAINSNLNGTNLSVDVKVIYANGAEPGDKLVVYLLENGIVADQINYFNTVEGHPYYGAGNPIIDYVHNDVLRNSLSDLFGDPIPETSAFEEYSKSYAFEVPSDYVANNLSFVVMVVKADNRAKNSLHAELGENKIFQ